jgi:hypothetical protein
VSYKDKLRWSGSKPFESEKERLPHQIYNVLTNTDNMYEEIAQTWWLLEQLEDDLAGVDDVPEPVHDAVFAAMDDPERGLRGAVNTFVGEWLKDQAVWLVDEWGIERGAVNTALEGYDVRKRVDGNGDLVPRRSEPADFDGGESTGVQDLR